MFELAALVLLPWWFFGGLLTLILLDVIFLENDNEGWGTLVTLVGTAVLFQLIDVNLALVTWNNLSLALTYFSGYFAVGGLWSVIKWYFYLLKVRDDLREKISRWERRMNPTAEDNNHRTRYDASSNRPARDYRTKANHNKARIMGWIGHWPISMLQTLIGDFLLRITKSIFRMLTRIYDSIGNHVFSGLE